MLKTLGIVQACCHARQFRCRAARKLGGRSVLEWVIRHVTDSMRLDGVIVLVCDEADHRFMRNLVPADVPMFVGTRAGQFRPLFPSDGTIIPPKSWSACGATIFLSIRP